MNPDAKAFEDAIRNNPEDRTTILVYADWCQDHDQTEFALWLRDDKTRHSIMIWARHGYWQTTSLSMFHQYPCTAFVQHMAELGKFEFRIIAEQYQRMFATFDAAQDFLNKHTLPEPPPKPSYTNPLRKFAAKLRDKLNFLRKKK